MVKSRRARSSSRETPYCDHCVPAIGGYVPAEGGDLVQYPIAIQHANGSILDANRHGSGKEALHLLRCGRRGNIVIGLRMPQQTIPQSAAYTPGLEPGVLQAARDLRMGSGICRTGGKDHSASVRAAGRNRDHQLHASL